MNSDQAEKLLELVAPTLRHAKCSHKKAVSAQVWNWDYWKSDTGLCWCNQCGKCLNGQYEYDLSFNG